MSLFDKGCSRYVLHISSREFSLWDKLFIYLPNVYRNVYEIGYFSSEDVVSLWQFLIACDALDTWQMILLLSWSCINSTIVLSIFYPSSFLTYFNNRKLSYILFVSNLSSSSSRGPPLLEVWRQQFRSLAKQNSCSTAATPVHSHILQCRDFFLFQTLHVYISEFERKNIFWINLYLPFCSR